MSEGSNILKLVTPGPPAPVDENCVALLERLLADAKAGEFNGIACITITSDNAGAYSALGTSFDGAGIHQNAHTAVGGCEVLKRRMLDKLFCWDEAE
jgi:hypothetical protein